MSQCLSIPAVGTWSSMYGTEGTVRSNRKGYGTVRYRYRREKKMCDSHNIFKK